jgi:alkaline phosphatase D
VASAIAEIDRSQCAAVDITDLEPGRPYQVTITSDDGVRLGPHHVQTAPRPDDPRPVRIAVSADVDPNPEFSSDLLEHLANASPELFVSIGDFPYADNGPGPAMTVGEYRERYVEARTEPRIRRWLETVGVRAIYDDHEFRNDWDAYYREVEVSRYAAAMQVWDEMFPLRGSATSDIRYRSWRWGAHLECFLLDCRRFRSANAMADDAGKTMLGATQLAWLLDGVQRSTATFKVVFTSVPLDFGDGNDHWAAFTVERDAIFRALVGTSGVLFISGDQHVFGAHRHAHGVREMQVGPLCRGIGTPQRTAPGVLFREGRLNFGLLDVDGSSLVFSAVGADGEVFYKETLSVSDLTVV